MPDANASQSYGQRRQEHRWDVPRTFNFGTDVVDRQARLRNGPALIWANAAGEERRFSYSDMAALTDRAGAALRRLGVAKGDRVLVMLPRIPEWMVAVVGALKIGAVPIPCVEMLTARDIAFRVADAGAVAAICRGAQAEKFAGSLERLAVRLAVGGAPGWRDWDAELAAAEASGFEAATVAAEDPAIMYYTSGSTGHAKGVLHPARSLYAWRASAEHWLDLGPDDRIWCTADTGWSKAGTSILFGPWSRGACSFFYDGPFVPAERLRLLAEHRITVYCAPGTELFRVADEAARGSFDLSALRRAVTAGEALSRPIAARWTEATGVAIAEAYGQTETLMVVLNTPGDEVRIGSMGRPAPGSEVAVVDPAGNRLLPGQEGQIAVRMPNPQMMAGYWNAPERTEACYVRNGAERWYLTGDLAVADGDGYLWYRGRADDLINSAGYRIGPLEVEDALLEHPAVQMCAVVGSPDAERGEVVKAFVVLRDGVAGSEGLAAELQEHVKRVTAPYKYPRRVAFVPELPMTATGKIRRRSLRDAEYARTAP